ncbi:CDP-diacylglycerol---serine O-phosphatidyltransferase [Micromonospora rhizosphaerae]|uniref:CDP-diacylglycerol---serine O-phosphatidyltransferase n=2 Tax=Micromonospora rhizosphaerae TaxID=568872 RepID=A0A1C6TJW0_9ACTN|nr:CDP-diacylglycerol---serine O-phosphatidyltransferase [Micromonospora rhizosphaerae]SCL41872.1 CDP-diacylglycerol---serine O-phosphatidyltransferase [Micromonospora rhizosphaerae]
MPRAPWRRRRTTDSPRPAGRRWAGRLRRSSTFARQVLLVRVGRRDVDAVPGNDLVVPDHRYTDRQRRRYGRDRFDRAEVEAVVPVSPALAPTSPVDDAPPMSIPLLPGDRTAARRMKFAVVNACTLSSLMLGMLAIFLAMQGEVRVAALCLIACVAFDGLDGALARKLGVASPFGAQMDSLADMCSFGLAAPVVVYASLAGSVPPAAAAVACALVAACAAIRLARFNVSPKDGRFFCGVPTTMAAAVLALTVAIGLPVSGLVMVGGVALLGVAMVSSFPYAKVARLVKLPPWLWLAPVIGALVDIRLTFALVVVGYLVSGPLLWLHQRHTA